MDRDLYDFDDLLLAMEGESDLGLVLVGAAIIDDGLRWALENALSHTDELDLFHEFHPLGPFGAKIDMAYALDLIDADLRSDLRRFNDIRNDAAHLKRGSRFDLNDQSFSDRISSFREIQRLAENPDLLQKDVPLPQRKGVLYEEARSKLHWSLIEWSIQLRYAAPDRPSDRPTPRYSIGDRVEIELVETSQVRDLGGQETGTGRIVEMPGGVVYNVLLDEPPSPDFNMLTYLSEGHILRRLGTQTDAQHESTHDGSTGATRIEKDSKRKTP